MDNFNLWFNNKLTISRAPTPIEILELPHKYIINVSDEFFEDCYETSQHTFKKYFWFPMNEVIGDMGLNSLYGALQILFLAERQNASVLLHCHAGVNRSPTVACAYYFLRTKTHFKEKIFDKEAEIRLDEMFTNGSPPSNTENRLLYNIRKSHLPINIELFLINCEIQFKKDEDMRGGDIDWCKKQNK